MQVGDHASVLLELYVEGRKMRHRTDSIILGIRLSRKRDLLARGLRITSPLTHQTNISFFSFAQPTEIRDALNHSTFYDYDPTWGLLTSVRDHLNNTTTYVTDILGRRLSVTDPRGATPRFTHDPLNRVTVPADPLGAAVRFQYDPNSNLTKVIDSRGGEIAYAYDNMDRLQTRTDPLGRQETLAYDLAGNLTSFTDRKNQVTTWSPYDDLNRPTTVTFQGGSTLTYGYDAANRLQTITDSITGAITWAFDALNRMTSETTSQGVVTYAPDDADRRTSMTVAGQPSVSYTWDNADRLTDITRGSLHAVYGYDNANRRTSLQLPNLVTIAYGYDDANRLTTLTYSGLVGGSQLLTYSYDTAGNRTVMSGSWARTLLPAAISGANYDAANRQLTIGGKTMTYDNNGNLATLTESGQTTTYTWDPRDRLTGLSGPALSASFAYDAKARRTQKTITGFTSTFQYDGADIVREVAGGSGVNYLRGLAMDEHLARVEDGGNTTCYAPDALGSTVALTDSGGGVATEYTYEPFGRTTTSGGASQDAFQYTGRENDGTGLYYYRARYYSPALHRFSGEDPIRLAGGDVNLFRYVRNSPTGTKDPSGTCAGTPFIQWPLDTSIAGRKGIPTIQLLLAAVGSEKFSESCYQCATRIYAVMRNRYPDPVWHNFRRHCNTACEISKQCPGGSFLCARPLGIFKEGRDLLPGGGKAEWQDLQANEAGITCSRAPSCEECCRSTREGMGSMP